MNRDQITCLIPTYNRAALLRRLLYFNSQFSRDIPYLVLDSSDPQEAAENHSAVEVAQTVLRLDYRHYDQSYLEKCIDGLGQVRTPFVALCAEDDVLFPETVKKAVEFLQREPSFSSAMGKIASLDTTPRAWLRRPKILKGFSITNERPLDRCRQQNAISFTSFYAVHRRDDMLRDFHAVMHDAFGGSNADHLQEMSLTLLRALRGRLEVLSSLYSIRQIHTSNAAKAFWQGEVPDAEAWFQRFKHFITDQFVASGAERDEVERFIDERYGHLRDSATYWKRRRPMSERIRRLGRGCVECMVDLARTDRVRRARGVRSIDIAGCEKIWYAAVRLIREYPNGLPLDVFEANMKQ